MTATTNLRADTAPAPTGSARGVWWVLGGILAFATIAWGTFNVITLIAHEEYDIERTFPAADVDTLDVSTDQGSVTVVATPGDQISVDTHVSDGLAKTKVRQEIVDGVLQLHGSCPGVLGDQWCDSDFTVEIPPDRPVTINADNGSVEVTGMQSALDLENDNGRIEIEDASGNITVENDNGRITATGLSSDVVNAENDNARIELTFVEPPTTVRARNDNGAIEILLPRDDRPYNITPENSNGSTDVGQIPLDPNSDRTIDVENDNGSITVRYAQ